MSKKSNLNLIIKSVAATLAIACATVVAGLGLQSCNVVRTITNQSEYLQKGDTSVVIQTKTVERYDASKNLLSGKILIFSERRNRGELNAQGVFLPRKRVPTIRRK